MVLSPAEYRHLLGVQELRPEGKLSEVLLDMIKESIGSYTDNLVVEALGTEETQDLRLRVSIKALEVTT